MIKRFVTIFSILIAFPCFSREIIVGVINDGPHYYDTFHNNTIIRQKADVITLVKKELKRKFKHDTLTFKFIKYDASNLYKAAKTIEEKIKSIKPHIIFGPFLNKTVSHLAGYIRSSKIPFISHSYYSNLRHLENYYTPFEWNDTYTKLTLDKAKKITYNNNPKIGAFVFVTNDFSKDAYDSARKFLKNDLHNIKLVHSKSKKYWNYKHKLNKEISKMMHYSPDIVLNANSMDMQMISINIILKMMEKGFKGMFLDTGSWGCSELSLERYRNHFKNVKGRSTGLSSTQLKCFQDLGQDEKKFRNKILHNDDKYYTSTGLFYKTLKHVLNSILESHLPINSSNIQKIIQKNSFFKGFSYGKFNLYKTKDSPEFLNIYKYYFEKNFRIERLSEKDSNNNKDKLF